MYKKNRKFVTLLLAAFLTYSIPIQVFAAADELGFVAVEENISAEENSATAPNTTEQKVSDVADSVQTFGANSTEEEPNVFPEQTDLESCLVSFDNNDGKENHIDPYTVTVPLGGKITDKPAAPTRDGYIFMGWYSYFDENGNPVLWDFETDTVSGNMSLWAAWQEETNGGGTNGGGTNGGGTNSGGTNSGGTNSGGTNSGGGSNGIDNNGTVVIEKISTTGNSTSQDNLPKTGDNHFYQVIWWLVCSVSFLGVIILMVQRRKKHII